MGILINDQTEMIFTCDDCGDTINSLEDGQYVDLGHGKKLLLHGPMASPCFQKWFEQHTEPSTVYHLPVLVMRLAATYGDEWTKFSTWKGERA